MPTAVGELFVALLDLVGFFTFGSGDDRTTRQHLVQSLKFLSAELQALQSNDRENTRRNDESSFRQLLLVEDEIAGVRRDATAFLETIVNERSEFFALSQDIESSIHFQKRELGSWLLFNRSLVTEYRIQSQMEELMATRCLRHTLDSLYSVDRCETEVQFQQLIQCLSREALIRMPQFREGVALVRQLVLQEGNVMHGTQIDSNAVVSRESADESLVEANYALADDAILQSHTIGSACEVFFRSKDAAWYTATPKVTAVLVVGSEGSGKTHLCNEVERLASLSSTSLGTYLERLVMCKRIFRSMF